MRRHICHIGERVKGNYRTQLQSKMSTARCGKCRYSPFWVFWLQNHKTAKHNMQRHDAMLEGRNVQAYAGITNWVDAHLALVPSGPVGAPPDRFLAVCLFLHAQPQLRTKTACQALLCDVRWCDAHETSHPWSKEDSRTNQKLIGGHLCTWHRLTCSFCC